MNERIWTLKLSIYKIVFIFLTKVNVVFKLLGVLKLAFL